MNALAVFATATLVVATVTLSVLGRVSPIVAFAVYLVGSVVAGLGCGRLLRGRA